MTAETLFAQGVTKDSHKWQVHCGSSLKVLGTFPSNSYDCVVTSPPYYWLRDYGVDGQIGLEDTADQFVSTLCDIMDQVCRVLTPDGVLFLNLGDTYYSGKGASQGIDRKNSKRRFGLRAVDKSGGLGVGLRPKTLIGIPWRVSLEMIRRGWILRSSIIWYRQHALKESVRDRPRRSYENVFMFVKSRTYYFDRSVLNDLEQEDMWPITARPKATKGISTAPFPDELVKRCLSIGCPSGGTVLDPFAGSGTTLRVAVQSGRHATGIDLSYDFCNYMANELKTI